MKRQLVWHLSPTETEMQHSARREGEWERERTAHRSTRLIQMPVNILLCSIVAVSVKPSRIGTAQWQTQRNRSPWRIQFNVCCCRCELNSNYPLFWHFPRPRHSTAWAHVRWERWVRLCASLLIFCHAMSHASAQDQWKYKTHRKRTRTENNIMPKYHWEYTIFRWLSILLRLLSLFSIVVRFERISNTTHKIYAK